MEATLPEWTVERDLIAHDRNFVWMISTSQVIADAEQVFDLLASHVDFGIALIREESRKNDTIPPSHIRHFAKCLTFYDSAQYESWPVWVDLVQQQAKAKALGQVTRPLLIYVRIAYHASDLVRHLLEQRHELNLCFVFQTGYWVQAPYGVKVDHIWEQIHHVTHFRTLQDITAGQSQFTENQLRKFLHTNNSLIIHSSPNKADVHASLMNFTKTDPAVARARQEARRKISREFHWSLDGKSVVMMTNWSGPYEPARLARLVRERQDSLALAVELIADILRGGTDVAHLVCTYAWMATKGK
jgi:hypothetical protein